MYGQYIIQFIGILSFLKSINPIDLQPINHPILPLNLGNAKIAYSYHTFIHYFNYTTITTQLDLIHENIQIINNKFENLSIDLTNTTVILSKINFKDLDYSYQQAIDKYNNLLPHIRIKRGLINAIGTTYKWAFGTLDAEDGERYDQAIETLIKNQHLIHTGFNEQMSFSRKLIEKLNNTLIQLNNNQIDIVNHINQVQTNLDNWFLAITSALTLDNVARQVLNNCLLLINLIEELENSISFGTLNIVNLNTLKPTEILEMINYMEIKYPKQFVKFNSVMTYYHLIKTKVYFTKDRIVFINHMPLFKPIDYQYLKLFTIPLNKILTVPSTPYLLANRAQTLGRSTACNHLEDIYLCSNEDFTQDECLDNLLKDPHKNQCPSRPVEVKQTITYQMDDNLLIIPKIQGEYLYERCQYDTEELLETPSILKMKPSCKYNVTNLIFNIDNVISTSKPIILPKINIEIPKNFSFNSIKLKQVRIDDINSLNKLINIMEPLQEISYISHRTSTIVIFLVITGIIVFTCLWYRYCGCRYLKTKKKFQSPQIVMIHKEAIPLEPQQSFPN